MVTQPGSVAELVVVLFAVTDFVARVLTIEAGECLPFGPLMPVHHSLQAGARAWVHQQTGQPLGYMEQLYTFVDVKRASQNGYSLIYISYLGLVQEADESGLNLAARWQDYYVYFPWEDTRSPTQPHILAQIMPLLQYWVDAAPDPITRSARQQRLNLGWGLGEYTWLAENTLLRYELLYEVGLIPESPYYAHQLPAEVVGVPMKYDHRRILATAVSRLRAKLHYRPVIFDLMPPQFTLYQLQRSIEALSGTELHKQNFRRLVHHQQLVIPTGQSAVAERGRPAQLFCFNQAVLQESLLSGYRLPILNQN
ncbi:hypothetical protein PT286_03605 [Neisseriaceae bacterium ESL0693]|nr:hypothetical protein [Neisseriaceae bacterium ESL0693]